MKEDKKGDGDTVPAALGRSCAGAVAGTMGTIVGHPLEIIKVRLQGQTHTLYPKF